MTKAASHSKASEPVTKFNSVAAGTRLQGTPKAEAATANTVRYGMVIDLERCFGCRACMVACKVENNTPKAHFWMYVFRWEEGKYPNVRVVFLPRPCMHCDNAPCVKVCPTSARHYGDNGLVLTDFEKCIGCRYCVVACPYSVNSFNWKHPNDNQYYDWKRDEGAGAYGSGSMTTYSGGVIPPYENPDLRQRYGSQSKLVAGSGHFLGISEKCTFCVHRVTKGLLPACVANCPVNVFHFGDLNDPNSEVSQVLAKKRSFRLLEELGTEPKVYYVGSPGPIEAARPLDTIYPAEIPWGRVR